MIEGIRRRFEAATPGPYDHDNGALEQHWSCGQQYLCDTMKLLNEQDFT